MTNNFHLIYKILTIYKNALWAEGVAPDVLSPQNLGTTEVHIRNILHVLRNAGHIIGTNGNTVITLEGLKYLEEDTQMKAIAGERRPYSCS